MSPSIFLWSTNTFRINMLPVPVTHAAGAIQFTVVQAQESSRTHALALFAFPEQIRCRLLADAAMSDEGAGFRLRPRFETASSCSTLPLVSACLVHGNGGSSRSSTL